MATGVGGVGIGIGIARAVSVRMRGIVLAAGAGTRMGGPKALLLVNGAPLALAHLRRLREAGCTDVILVTRAELVDRFASERVVISGAPDPAGSLALGLRALAPADDEVIVVTPVDALPARTDTIALLVAAVRAGAAAATPTFAGRGGHPVVARGRVLASIATAATPLPLRDVLAALGAARVRVEVDDPAAFADLDTPADVAQVTKGPVRFA